MKKQNYEYRKHVTGFPLQSAGKIQAGRISASIRHRARPKIKRQGLQETLNLKHQETKTFGLEFSGYLTNPYPLCPKIQGHNGTMDWRINSQIQ